ncbi:MAG: hypothetical protein E7262_06690 [Lachnospiraceae bacterium]|nr:hypothetical protein [Lachnospiraceae bacterium]
MDQIRKLGNRLKREWIEFYMKVDWTYVTMISLVLLCYLLVHDLVGETLLKTNSWDSYSLQTRRWLEGEVALERNYGHLELAIYKGRYFVSFPPFPSVLLIPWVLIYEEFTPNNIIMIIYVVIAITLAYKICKHFKMRNVLCAFWSVVVVLGCNMMWMSTMGGVWFQAQLVNMMLLLAAILSMLNNKRILSYIFVACAVGCRPFSILYFFVLLVYYFNMDYKEYRDNRHNIDKKDSDIDNQEENVVLENNAILYFKLIMNQFNGLVSAAIIGMGYMLYNYARFDNPLEFGHNYLPEFVESKDGQFNISYLLTNLYRVFIKGIKLKDNMGIEFTIYDGFWVHIANPIYILLYASIIISLYRIIKKGYKIDAIKITIIITLVTNIICLCLHKTMGGWQFGNRYLVDLIPFIFLYIILTKKQVGKINKLSRFEIFVGLAALIFNAYGTAFMYVNDLLEKMV